MTTLLAGNSREGERRGLGSKESRRELEYCEDVQAQSREDQANG